jgi:L-malate glycosyltransferase
VNDSPTIGILGPILLRAFGDWLDDPVGPDSPNGLGGTPVNLLCRELLARGHSLRIFTLDPSVRDELTLRGPNLRIYVGPYRPKRARDFFSEERGFLCRMIARDRPDILHAHWTYEFALAALATGLPAIITAHDAPLRVLRQNLIPYRIIRTFMAYRCLFFARQVAAVSPHVATHLRRWMLYKGRLAVIPNGLPSTVFDLGRNRLLADHTLTVATVLPGFSGLKNGEAAIDAFSSFNIRSRYSRLLMFGRDNGPGESAERYAIRTGRATGVEFIGEVPHEELLHRLSVEVDVLLHPSLEEANPMAVIEAMALGIAVIAGAQSGGVPWTVGTAGMLCDVSSVGEICNALVRLADDPEFRRSLGRAGVREAEERFHLGKTVDAYEGFYRELLPE